jgi:uncharacterized protein (TIGR03083 family)
MDSSNWNFMDPASKDHLLSVIRREFDETLELATPSDRWNAPTACEGWEVRDVIGHLVDTTEEYLRGFEAARTGAPGPEPLGLPAMSENVDRGAKALRDIPQDELLGRLRTAADEMMAIFEATSDEDWTGHLVPHLYMGPLPVMFYAIFQLVDYAVHSWDIREGIGRPHNLSGDAADFLVPVMFILWQYTTDTSKVTEAQSVGVRVSGNNGGDTRLDISPDGVQFAPGDISDCAAIIEFDPATFVLTGYARINGGTVRGDREAAAHLRSIIFPI